MQLAKKLNSHFQRTSKFIYKSYFRSRTMGKTHQNVNEYPKTVSAQKSESSEKMERVPSGIDGFDDLVEGGFLHSTINLLAGKKIRAKLHLARIG